jgi:hypothetical protein
MIAPAAPAGNGGRFCFDGVPQQTSTEKVMDTLHDVMRSISNERKAETEPRRDHLSVFREFLDHLEWASKRRVVARTTRGVKSKRARRR